jgi:hypothetical protein
LERARDVRNGVPVNQVLKEYPGEIWRLQAEPCAQRQYQASVQKQPWFDEQAEAMSEQKTARLSAELRARGVSPEAIQRLSAVDEQARYQCFLHVSTEVLGSLGFKLDERRSRHFHPVLSKELTKEWDICWTPGDHQRFGSSTVSLFSSTAYAPTWKSTESSALGSRTASSSGLRAWMPH